MKKFLIILCVVLVARIHAENQLDEDVEDDNSDEDSDQQESQLDEDIEDENPDEDSDQQEVEGEDGDNESQLDEDIEDDYSDDDPDQEAEDGDNESQLDEASEDYDEDDADEVGAEDEDNENLPFFPRQYDVVVDVCRLETGYTDEVLAKEKASYFSENRGLRIFNYCFLEKTGLVTRDGKLNIDNASHKVTSSFPATFELCFRREKKYPVCFFFQCFHWKVSLYMRLTDIGNVIRAFTKKRTQIVESCRMETGYTEEVIAEEEKSDLDKDEGLKKFNNCFLEKNGFGANEKFDIDKALAKIPESKVTDIIKICESKTKKKIIPDSVPFFSACLHLEVFNYFRSVPWNKFSKFPETEHITQIVDVCRMEIGFTDVEVYYKVEVDNITEEEALRKFNNCFLEKTGVITSDGKLNIDAALAKLPPSFAKPIIEHCQANIILKYSTDSVHDFSNCFLHAVQSRFPLNSLELNVPLNHTEGIQHVIPGTSFAGNVFILY